MDVNNLVNNFLNRFCFFQCLTIINNDFIIFLLSSIGYVSRRTAGWGVGVF